MSTRFLLNFGSYFSYSFTYQAAANKKQPAQIVQTASCHYIEFFGAVNLTGEWAVYPRMVVL